MIMMTEYNAEDPQTFDLANALPEAVVDYFDAEENDAAAEALYGQAADAMLWHFDRCSEAAI